MQKEAKTRARDILMSMLAGKGKIGQISDVAIPSAAAGYTYLKTRGDDKVVDPAAGGKALGRGILYNPAIWRYILTGKKKGIVDSVTDQPITGGTKAVKDTARSTTDRLADTLSRAFPSPGGSLVGIPRRAVAPMTAALSAPAIGRVVEAVPRLTETASDISEEGPGVAKEWLSASREQAKSIQEKAKAGSEEAKKWTGTSAQAREKFEGLMKDPEKRKAVIKQVFIEGKDLLSDVLKSPEGKVALAGAGSAGILWVLFQLLKRRQAAQREKQQAGVQRQEAELRNLEKRLLKQQLATAGV